MNAFVYSQHVGIKTRTPPQTNLNQLSCMVLYLRYSNALNAIARAREPKRKGCDREGRTCTMPGGRGGGGAGRGGGGARGGSAQASGGACCARGDGDGV